MARVTLNLLNSADLGAVGARWRLGHGLVPGEPNEGLIAQMEGSSARESDYDDSSWEETDDISIGVSKGFTFAWYRINVTIPERVEGRDIRGSRIYLETCIDDYGEIWVDGQCDYGKGVVQGFNIPQRVTVSADAQPGNQHTIALLAINGPIAKPGGTVFVRYATLAFE